MCWQEQDYGYWVARGKNQLARNVRMISRVPLCSRSSACRDKAIPLERKSKHPHAS